MLTIAPDRLGHLAAAPPERCVDRPSLFAALGDRPKPGLSASLREHPAAPLGVQAVALEGHGHAADDAAAGQRVRRPAMVIECSSQTFRERGQLIGRQPCRHIAEDLDVPALHARAA